MNPFQYMPILRWKRGEQQALQLLTTPDKLATRPLLEVMSEALEDDDTDASYDKLVKQLNKAWGSQSPVCLELGAFDAVVIAEIFDRARAADILAVPVTGVCRDAAHYAAVAAVARTDRRGVLLRVTPDEIAEVAFAQDMDTALTALRLKPSDVDVLVDAGFTHVTPQMNVTSQTFLAVGLVSNVLGLKPWRSVTYAASAFPDSLASITGSGTLPRAEWTIWKNVAARLGAQGNIIFGDYAVAHPIYSPVSYAGAANIRYTLEDVWLILRGRKVTGPQYGGFGQYVTLAQALVTSPNYSGPTFSWGDEYISECAAGTVSTGNMTTWRAVATNHHITFVLRQLASLRAPSSAP